MEASLQKRVPDTNASNTARQGSRRYKGLMQEKEQRRKAQCSLPYLKNRYKED
jgi:hypothetical protein